MTDRGNCQYEICDREATLSIVGWPEGRFHLCAVHQPLVHHRLTEESYRWHLQEADGRITFVEKVPWDPVVD
jgi:hypothetical protein